MHCKQARSGEPSQRMKKAFVAKMGPVDGRPRCDALYPAPSPTRPEAPGGAATPPLVAPCSLLCHPLPCHLWRIPPHNPTPTLSPTLPPTLVELLRAYDPRL